MENNFIKMTTSGKVEVDIEEYNQLILRNINLLIIEKYHGMCRHCITDFDYENYKSIMNQANELDN